MDCLLCCMVVNNEKEFENYNRNPQVCKKSIVKLFKISGDPDVQRLSEDLLICIGCRRKLENVVDLVTQLEELQRRVYKARIEIIQGLMVSQRVSEFMAKDFGMSKSAMDRLVLLKAIESTGNCRPPAPYHDGFDVGGSTDNECGYFEVQQSLEQAEEPEILNLTNEERQVLPIGATVEREVNISRFQIPPMASTVKHEEKFNPVPSNSKAGARRKRKQVWTTTVVEESSIDPEGHGSESAFEDDKSSEVGTEGESGSSKITSNEIKLPRREYGSIIKEFTLMKNGSYKCKKCSKILTKKGSLRAHFYTHRPRRFQCPIQDCGKWFTLKEIRDTHVKTVHEGRRDFNCRVGGCGKAFSSNYYLRKHMSAMHNKSAAKKKRVEVARVISPEVVIPDLEVEVFEVFNCRMTPDCSNEFTSEDARNAHERSHAK